MLPFRTRSSAETLWFLCEKGKVLCHNIYKTLVISTFTTGEKPDQIKSNSLTNVRKYRTETNIKGNLKLSDPEGSCINATDLLCYSWKVISQYLSNMISQST